MKIQSRSLIAPLLAIAIGLFILFIDRNTGHVYTERLRDKYVNLLISSGINGVVTRVYRTDIENFSRGEFFRRSVQINYTDLETGNQLSFDTDLRNEEFIEEGDTILKKPGAPLFRVLKRDNTERVIEITYRGN